MEPLPSTSHVEPPKRKRKLSHLSEGEKNMIIDVFKYVKESWPVDTYPYKQDMKDKTAYILGISRQTVYKILREYTKTHTVKPAAKPKKRSSLIESMDNFDKSNIRQIVYSFYFKGELPTVRKVLSLIKADKSLPKMGLTSLQTILKHLKFSFVKIKIHSGLIDEDDVALWRIKYLENIKTYREQGRPIYYLHEKWVTSGHNTKDKMWEDSKDIKDFMEDCSPSTKKSTSESNRLIIIHIGGETGFVPESELIFECNGTGDKQKLMNAVKFENWFQAVLPKLEPNAVVVMDNANDYSRLKEIIPARNWLKQDIQEWLSSNQISFKINDTKVQLLEKVNNIKAQYQSYVIDEIAKEGGVEVLRLPPYHSKLNPMELFWADVKTYVSQKSTTDKSIDIKLLLLQALNNITTEKWHNYMSNIKKEEIKLGELENIIDKTIDSFISNVTESTSTESVSETDESVSE